VEETTRRATQRPDATITTLATTPESGILTDVIRFETSAANEFLDLTDDVREHVTRSGVRHGQVTVMTPHTTTAVAINESETGFLNDFRRMISEMIPVEGYYEHDDHEVRTENLQEDEYINGHAHVRQMLVGSTTVTVPVVDGELILGRWQRILFVELDQPRARRAVLHTQGV
jgi:secondary thiamine-phosphate synthase enzyme